MLVPEAEGGTGFPRANFGEAAPLDGVSENLGYRGLISTSTQTVRSPCDGKVGFTTGMTLTDFSSVVKLLFKACRALLDFLDHPIG